MDEKHDVSAMIEVSTKSADPSATVLLMKDVNRRTQTHCAQN